MRFWTRSVACMAVVLTLACLLAPAAQAAPKVILYGIRLTAEPSIAGKNMDVTVTASIEFGGACCYTVFAHDVTAEFNVSDPALKIRSGKITQPVTSSGESEGRVAALPGGGLTKVKLQWVVNSDTYGDYEVSLHVRGFSLRTPDPDELFEQTEKLLIRIVPGASISKPMYPHPPSVNKETVVLVNVTAVTGSVSSVVLNYSFDNKTWVSLPMKRTTIENDNWIATLPSQTSETSLYFYMFSVNSLNQTFTTPMYQERIRDWGAINAIPTFSASAITIGTIASAVFIAYLYVYSRRVARARKELGLLCIGQDELVTVQDATSEITLRQRLLAERRRLAIITVVILLVSFFAYALVTGQFETIVSKTTNPLGS